MSTRTLSQGSIVRWMNTILKWEATEDIHLGLHPNLPYLKNKLLFPDKRIRQENDVITKKYFFLDDKGQVKYEGEPGKEEPCLLPDMKMEDYNQEINSLMSKKIEIKL